MLFVYKMFFQHTNVFNYITTYTKKAVMEYDWVIASIQLNSGWNITTGCFLFLFITEVNI